MFLVSMLCKCGLSYGDNQDEFTKCSQVTTQQVGDGKLTNALSQNHR